MFRKSHYLFVPFLLFLGTVSASNDMIIKDSRTRLSYTYRQDDIKFYFDNSFFDFQDHFTQSYDAVKIQQVTGVVELQTYGNVYFKTEGDFGWAFDGSAESGDFIGGYSLEDKGCVTDAYVFDFSASVGYVMNCAYDGYKLIPQVGYTWDQQHLETKYVRVVKDTVFDTMTGSSIEGLHRQYKANWFGPWIGLTVVLDPYRDWEVYFDFEYHWAQYLASFKHQAYLMKDFTMDQLDRQDYAWGQGFVGNAGFKYNCTRDFFCYALGGYEAYNARRGYTKDAMVNVYSLKYLYWRSAYGTIGFGYNY